MASLLLKEEQNIQKPWEVFMNNMQNKPHGQPRPQGRRIAAIRKFRSASSLHWLTALLIIGAIIFFPERPAWGGEFNVETGPDGIKGYARQISLGEILGYLADRNGYVVQIDQALLNAPATFNIPMPIPAERAIQRIVHPHSIALVFTRVPGKDEPVISQIKVFDKGSHSASYALLSGSGPQATYASPARYGTVRSDAIAGRGVLSGRDAVDKHVQRPVIITKNSMGFTGFKFKDPQRGPDYRPDTITMAQAYADFRAESNALNERVDYGTLHSAQQKVAQEKVQYRNTRTLSLQQTISDSKQ
jgi:hypothetical protein